MSTDCPCNRRKLRSSDVINFNADKLIVIQDLELFVKTPNTYDICFSILLLNEIRKTIAMKNGETLGNVFQNKDFFGTFYWLYGS